MLKIENTNTNSAPETIPGYIPSEPENLAKTELMRAWIQGRNITQRGYNQLNGRNLYDAIDDWTMRWNGFITVNSQVDNAVYSNIFLNFTRNLIIGYLSKVAMQRPKPKIKAVNKKTKTPGKRMGEVFETLVEFSDTNENADARFLESALECTIKGTVIVYEGYKRYSQVTQVPVSYDPETGLGKFKQEDRIVYDDCFQKVVPIEDVYISNPYEQDIQKQPFLFWREITTYDEAKCDFGHTKNWQFVKPGSYSLASEPTTFYRNRLYTELSQNQVEVLRYYHRLKNRHIVQVNGVIIYEGPMPFKDGKYPFSKTIFEPFDNSFFWGMGYPQKIMGEQDTQNTFVNMMIDKTYSSLLPYGLSSDLDDLIEDNVLAPNKIRKVGDINKWKFDTLPGVTGGEQAMFQMILGLGKDNAGNPAGGADAYSPRGGKLNVRQVLLQQQEAMNKIGFSAGFLENMERDRVGLRLSHILQFYSIPKIEKITGRNGKEIEQLIYRDIKVHDVTLSNGQKGSRYIKLIGGEYKNPDQAKSIADEMAVTEEIGALSGVPTEALAISIDTFYDWNYEIQIVRNSSYEKNAALDQASRQEYATWRIGMAQAGAPVSVPELVAWVDESFDIDTDRFAPEPQSNAPQVDAQGNPIFPANPNNPANPLNAGNPNSPQEQLASAKLGTLSNLTG